MQKTPCLILGLAAGSTTGNLQPPPVRRPHRHVEIEINLITGGSLTYLFGSSCITLQAGQLAVFWATIPHKIIEMDTTASLHWLTIPSGQFLQWQLPGSLATRVLDGNFLCSRGNECAHFDQRVFYCWERDLSMSSSMHNRTVLLEVEACMRRFAWACNRENGQAPDTEVQENIQAYQRVKTAIHYIAKHYTQPLTVAEVADTLKLHPHTVMRLFQQTLGMSIGEYITRYRLAHAQRLLLSTEKSVIEIATTSGFGSLSRFYAAFRELCGQTPQGYRKHLL